MTTTLARKTRRAFVLVLFTLVLLGIIVALELNAYQQSVGWVAHTNLVLSTMDHLLLAVTRAESAQRGFLLTQDQQYLGWFEKAQTEATQQVTRVRNLTVDSPTQQRNIRRLQAAVERRFKVLDWVIQRKRSGAVPDSKVGGLLLEGTVTMQQIWNVTHEVNDHESQLLGIRLKTERATAIGVGVSFSICFLVNLAVLFWAYRIIENYGRARELAAEQILRLNTELEQRVADRTSELQLANAQLTRSNDDLTKFAYIASHDLQEPLRTIGSYVGLLSLRYQGKLDDQADKYIKFVVDGAKRMQNLVQDLLIYSRVGTEALKIGPVNLDSVVSNVRENLDLLIREQQAVIMCNPLPSLTGDESKITQVFMNLISNAIKFRKPEEPPQIVIDASRLGDKWVFSISDNGIGFDQQYAQRIFAIFQRLHGVGAYPGTGMGLAICKRIIEQHQGRIWASSSPDCGSTFSFTLPMELPMQPLVDDSTANGGRMENEAVSK